MLSRFQVLPNKQLHRQMNDEHSYKDNYLTNFYCTIFISIFSECKEFIILIFSEAENKLQEIYKRFISI